MQIKNAVISVFVAAVAADAVSDLVAQIPECAVSCLIDGAGSVSCDLTDYACQCQHADALQQNVTPCVMEKCQTDDALKTQSITQQLCEAVSSSTGDATTAAATAATTAAADTTSAAAADTTSAAAADDDDEYTSVAADSSYAATATGGSYPTTVVGGSYHTMSASGSHAGSAAATGSSNGTVSGSSPSVSPAIARAGADRTELGLLAGAAAVLAFAL